MRITPTLSVADAAIVTGLVIVEPLVVFCIDTEGRVVSVGTTVTGGVVVTGGT